MTKEEADTELQRLLKEAQRLREVIDTTFDEPRARARRDLKVVMENINTLISFRNQ